MTIDSAMASGMPSLPLDVVFIHREFPGQFEALAETLMEQGSDVRLWAITRQRDLGPLHLKAAAHFSGIETYISEQVQGLESSKIRILEALYNGRSVAEKLLHLKGRGVDPSLIIGHLGWGECTHAKSIFPKATLLGYCEFFHHPQGVDAGFDPEFGARDLQSQWGIRDLNAVELLGLEAMDMGLSPTRWQRDLFPAAYRSRIRVIHEGVDTVFYSPKESAAFELPSGRVVTRKDKIVSFATSSLEPYRGIHTFTRSLPLILRQHPDCHIVIAGASGNPRYGVAPEIEGLPLVDALIREAGISGDHLHRVGILEREAYRNLLRVSSAHVYLTVPFVLSWSLMEAMATGCSVVASDTSPVVEVLRHEENALLVDFFSPHGVAEAVNRLLSEPSAFDPLGLRARQTILSRYDRVQAKRAYARLIDELLAIRGEFRERSFSL